MTGHCAIDLDQVAMERQLALQTPASLEHARRIYAEGGNAGSYATVTLAAPLAADAPAGAVAFGTSADGMPVRGKLDAEHRAGDVVVAVRYAPDAACRVGALGEETSITAGCLAASGVLQLDGAVVAYSYEPARDNLNRRTLAGLSRLAGAAMMWCESCPYVDFMRFYHYYGAS